MGDVGPVERCSGMASPIFIVGTMRSGSTMLRLMLDSHERIAIGPESGFVRAMPYIKTLPPWQLGPGWYERQGLSEADMDRRIADFFDGVFGEAAHRQGKERWGDKTPYHTERMAELAKLYPCAQFIGIVRHPGAVVTSLQHRGRSRRGAAKQWIDLNAVMLREGIALGHRFTLLRYEDLVHAPEHVLRALMNYLDEDWDDQLLAHHEVQARRGTSTITDGGTRVHEPLDDSRALRWREEMTGRHMAALARATADLRQVFGYSSDGVLPLPRQRPILSGSELGELLVELRVHLPRVPVRPRRTKLQARLYAARHALTLLRRDPEHALARLQGQWRRRTGRLDKQSGGTAS